MNTFDLTVGWTGGSRLPVTQIEYGPSICFYCRDTRLAVQIIKKGFIPLIIFADDIPALEVRANYLRCILGPGEHHPDIV